MMCAKITTIVNGLQKEYGKRIIIKTAAVKAKGSKEALKEAKITSHGIVGKDVNGKIIATVSGHNYKKDKVLEVFNKLLAKKQK